MLDKSVPFYPLAMTRPDGAPCPRFCLPDGFSFRPFTAGSEADWIAVQLSVGHVDTADKAKAVFDAEFAPRFSELEARAALVYRGSVPAAAAFLWDGTTFGEALPRVHWVAVAPEFQGLGLAKAMLSKLLASCGKAYLTTQTWSCKAVGIYYKFGFEPYIGPRPQNWDEIDPKGDFALACREGWRIVGQKLSEYAK